MKRAEDRLQRDIVDFLRLVLWPNRYRCFAIPNGGKRTPAEAAMLKATGVVAGVPDLEIIGDGKCFFIEVKAADGRLSPEQREFREWFVSADIPYAMVRSIADVEAALEAWRIPTRMARLI